MGAQTQTMNGQSEDLQRKVAKAKEIMADAPEVAKVALENVLSEIASGDYAPPTSKATSAGRIGTRQGEVSELTMIMPIKDGGAEQLKGLLELLDGSFQGADKVGSVHDMRFVFLDNDTKLLFATAYDGDWDAYIDDFGAKIPDYLDLLLWMLEDYPGSRSPEFKDWILARQITAAAWYVSSPDLTVAETRRLERVGAALDEFLDKIG